MQVITRLKTDMIDPVKESFEEEKENVGNDA